MIIINLILFFVIILYLDNMTSFNYFILFYFILNFIFYGVYFKLLYPDNKQYIQYIPTIIINALPLEFIF